MMSIIMIKFSSSKAGIVHKYHNHGTLIDFKLLYLMDFS
ncbi:BZ3500_MvSof-1268-A1-R1_C110g00605 [Microbotryum saponariae]|uniref:BZ3500_MvSof-1268-A1-R1_C041g00090 protein n=1 Tax=Microbotryum saponariae TaxID=289078 RepID=A0A2X0MCR0_9BASI|nr:BZ3501_MvSof-1269-A2-R1_C63g00355 [Microbotryum saponariae]SCZ88959.1 BZ3501_MvSof-1269-A2-R1_C45g00226 [Microbotryum saponariae]SCZ88965.1 BZ3501_MvSof-1269-A2-R1_C45g00230 [Microbotryum saponariae]SCZ92843.1 BZ3500_MvSof-1268-A1-R1_C060g00278 [Microbotryum saponariae]SCZ95427.1 BZ3500_MvSof-1268-A1-R1_C042g00097 [Microbotryum saponariae]